MHVLPQFEAMRVCMGANPGVFKEVLEDVEELSRTHTEQPPPPREAATPAAGKS